MLTFDEVDYRQYSYQCIPTIKDIAIALVHWSQYFWHSSEDYQSDISVLKRIKDSIPGATQLGKCQLFRGIPLLESDLTALRDGGSVMVSANTKTLPCEVKELESWATTYDSARRFAIRSRTGIGAIVQCDSNQKAIEWISSHVCRSIPKSITNIYPDLQDMEDEVVVSKPRNVQIYQSDIVTVFRSGRVLSW